MVHLRQGLGPALAELCRRYETPEALAADPLSEVLGYTDPADREVAAWVAAHLAYGRVAPMRGAIRRALAPLGSHPAEALRASSPESTGIRLSRALEGWRWRFHTGEDLAHWLLAWQRMDAEQGNRGLEDVFRPREGRSADTLLSELVQRLRQELPSTRGLRFNLPDPLEGAACKRWRMFLRWMVRTGWPDLGLWRSHPTSDLVIPLDTHVARVSRFLGFTRRTTADARTVGEITEALRTFDPEDPLRFDFGLSHLGILGHCPGSRRMPGCAPCPLAPVCRAR